MVRFLLRKSLISKLLRPPSRGHGLQSFSTGINLMDRRSRPRFTMEQKFDHFLFLDFEATCDTRLAEFDPQEIIEFPCIKVNASNFAIESIFYSFVRPIVNPRLSAFCTELTGISQEMVQYEKSFECVFQDFLAWIEREDLLKKRFTFVTCGDWDLKTMLPKQCEMSKLNVPAFCQSWINIKKSCHQAIGSYPRSMQKLMDNFGLEFDGRPHSGIDDTKNILRVAREMATRHKFVFENTTTVAPAVSKTQAHSF